MAICMPVKYRKAYKYGRGFVVLSYPQVISLAISGFVKFSCVCANLSSDNKDAPEAAISSIQIIVYNDGFGVYNYYFWSNFT